MSEPIANNPRRFAIEEEVEIAFKALETERPDDLELLYAGVIRGTKSYDKVYFDIDRSSLYAFLEMLPVRPAEKDRLRVASDLFSQLVMDMKDPSGPRSYKNRNAKSISPRRFATEAEAELAFNALESQRPKDLELLYAGVMRDAESDDKVYFDVDMPSLYTFLETLPVRLTEKNRLKVASDLFLQLVVEIRKPSGPRSYNNRPSPLVAAEDDHPIVPQPTPPEQAPPFPRPVAGGWCRPHSDDDKTQRRGVRQTKVRT